MSVVLKNVVIWTSRPSNSQGITGTASPKLNAVEAHAGPIPATDWIALPKSALESQYLIKVDIGTDVKFGDTVSKVAQNNPPAYTVWDQLGANETLFVTFARDSAAGPLQHRRVYAKRITAGGPSV
jgi:hypothetical protein